MEDNYNFELMHYHINDVHLFSHILDKVVNENLPNAEDFFLIGSKYCIENLLVYSDHLSGNYAFSDEVWDFILSSKKIMKFYSKDPLRNRVSNGIINELCKKQNLIFNEVNSIKIERLPTAIEIAISKKHYIKDKKVLSMSDGVNSVAHYYAMLGFNIEDDELLKIRNLYEVPVAHYVAQWGHEIPNSCLFIDGGFFESFYSMILENGWTKDNYKYPQPIITSYCKGIDYPHDTIAQSLGFDEKKLIEAKFEHYKSSENTGLNELGFKNSSGHTVAFVNALSNKKFYEDERVYTLKNDDGISVAHAMASNGMIINDLKFLMIEDMNGVSVAEHFILSFWNDKQVLSVIDLSILPKSLLNKKTTKYRTISSLVSIESDFDEMEHTFPLLDALTN